MINYLSICFISFIFLMGFSLMFMVLGVFFILNNMVYFIEWDLLCLNSNSIVMTILLDYMSLMFMGFVLFISSLVIFYSEEYMKGDMNINRFILLVLMFVLSMMLLIISPNMISILLGWDGLGLVSYCLVIYYQNIKSYNAGMLTALSNRIGDVAFLMAIAWMLNFGGWNYIFYLDYLFNSLEMFIISIFMLLAAMTKSAQIPFSSWLPAAMAAPTPVSALVHSSTLVTAGVYLLIRFNNLILSYNFISMFLLLISGVTMFMSGLGANYEFDLKKIIALSTLSQLGLMMSTLSLGFSLLAFFHLLTHALFKALLFMCAGMIIHLMSDSQDIRFMGGLSNQVPLTVLCFNVANLALCGMPFLSGFYSKDLILELVCMSNLNIFIFFLYFLSTGLTVCYSFRLVYYSMICSFNSTSLNTLDESSLIMLKGMLGLFFMVILGGSGLSWLIIPIPYMICLPFYLKILALLVSILGGGIGYFFYKMKLEIKLKLKIIYNLKYFVGMMWFMPILSTHNLMGVSMIGDKMFKSMDQGWSEFLGGQGGYKFLMDWSILNQWYQNNNLKLYLFIFIIWFIILMLMMFT
uniref:NADH-ubiquinone oxidoreductase chain 5 n=1 Tax=Pleroneura sp. 1 GYN-2021b TaxID=2899767 RepID=A0A9E9BPP2_9HYME|nr:NADH dehydrogenase subunit 5 [Pleroneura sp. 1 GYN-2021b]